MAGPTLKAGGCVMLVMATGDFCNRPYHHSFYPKGRRDLTWVCCDHFNSMFGLTSHVGPCNTPKEGS